MKMRKFLLLVVAWGVSGSAWAKRGVEFQMPLGNPSAATADATNSRTNYLVQRSQYAMSYNDDTRQPNWVSWSFSTGDYAQGGRGNNWAMDTNLPATFTLVGTNFFPGYDRGHMCPSADRSSSAADNDATFLMSNIIPQANIHNTGLWNDFEMYCRTLANDGSEVLIVCGPSSFTGSLLPNGMAVPGSVWKVAVVVPQATSSLPAQQRVTAGIRVLAIMTPNVNTGLLPWQSYLTTVRQVENATGLNFFQNVDPSLATYLKRVKDTGTGPNQPTVITSFFPVSGSPGTTVTLSGYNFGTAPQVWFSGVAAIASVQAGGTQINATVPAGATSGPITVTGSGGTDTSTGNFTVQSLATVNLQWPPRMSLGRAGEGTVYAQVYLPGRTEGAQVASNVLAWIGVHTNNSDPSGWPVSAWTPASLNLSQGVNASSDEYVGTVTGSGRAAGTYAYAARWQVDGGAYQYGGITSAGAGGAWGGEFGNGVLKVRASAIDWANLQWPPSGQVRLGDSFTVYARVYRAGMTPSPGAPGADFLAQIGVSAVDENPESSSAFLWLDAGYGAQYGNDDEFQRTVSGLAPGTYHYASRFSDDGGTNWTYGGILPDGSSGGVWDGATYNAGVLTVGSTIGSWSSNAPVTPELVGKYAIGGAANLSAASESPRMEAQTNTLSLTALVRKDDAKLSVEAEWVTDLAGGWSTSGVSSSTNGLSQPTDPGLERRKYILPYDSESEPRKFLRLKATLQP
jgi:DNA/RNA endonuclease G (NUC1)